MNKINKPPSNINPIKRYIILSQNSTTTLIDKNLNYLGIKTTTPHNKSNKTNRKEQLQKHKFPIQHRCLQNPLPKLQ